MTDKSFRDLNNNGQLDPYEDAILPIEERIGDLLKRMTLEEKAGLMFQNIIRIDDEGSFDPDMIAFGNLTIQQMLDNHMNDFYIMGSSSARKMAEWTNTIQDLAASSRLGIPITLTSDPRHCTRSAPTINIQTPAFSDWPEMTGFAAIGDEALVEEFADIARQEYVAVGLRSALHPVADIATEPRWARVGATFGADATIASRLVAAYIRGFQGKELGISSVACATKHFPGGGPQMDGEDPHFSYGREQVYPGDNFDYHISVFDAAFEAGTASIMPYYGMPIDTPYEAVGFGFNKSIITGLLREQYGFDGIIITDYGILTDSNRGGMHSPARAWGVEHLTLQERVQKALDAGIDQFGLENCPEVIVELVRNGHVTEGRINTSVRRILRLKFQLGLFDNPYVDPEAAVHIVGNVAFRSAGELAQRKSIVLLKNLHAETDSILPLKNRPNIYVENIDPVTASQYGNVVDNLSNADFAILRLETPYEPRDTMLLEAKMHAGDLDFKEPELGRILSILQKVPTIVDIHLERPAVIPEIAEQCAGLIASFGASDAAVLDVIFGRFKPSATLPFELPSSMDAVRQQKPDVPHDSDNPIFEYGFGLTY